MRLQHIRTLGELEGIKDEWLGLEKIENGPSIFQSWLWNRMWCEHVLSSLKHARLDVRIFEDEAGRPLAILPFFEEAVGGALLRLTQFLGHRMSFHNDVLLVDPKSSELAEEVVRVLLDDLGPRTVLHLRHLNEDSVFTKQLVLRRIAETQCTRLRVKDNPEITAQRMRLGRSKRKRLREQEKQLQRRFGMSFVVRSGDEYPKAFDVFLDLHHARSSSIKRSTLLFGCNLKFLKAATSLLSNKGYFEIVQLLAGEKIIAAVVMLRDKQCYFCIQSGFDPEFAAYSPMRLLFAESMRRGFEDLGLEMYDFGPGYERYKYEWSPAIGTNYFCSIGGAGLYAKSLATLHRVAFRRRVLQSHDKNIKR